MKKYSLAFLLLSAFFLKSFAQSKGDLLIGGFLTPGYAIDKTYGGIGSQLGAELTYNFTEKVPFSIFADAEVFGKMFIISGGFRIAHLLFLNGDHDKFFQLRGTLGGSTIFRNDGEFPGMGIRLALGFHYKALPTKNICYYIGPSFGGSFIGDNYNPLFATLEFGIGYYIW